MFGLNPRETAILHALSTPRKIQDFLDRLPINFEKHGDTYMSPRRVLRERKAHCVEGALLAVVELPHGTSPRLVISRAMPIRPMHSPLFEKTGDFTVSRMH